MTPPITTTISSTALLDKLVAAISQPKLHTADDVLIWAVHHKNQTVADLALKAGASPNAQDPKTELSALYLAAKHCDLPTMKVLLTAHAAPSATSGRFGVALPLFAALQSEASEAQICDAISLLANYGADMNASELPGSSALICALADNKLHTCTTLREYGATVPDLTSAWALVTGPLSPEAKAVLTAPVQQRPRVHHVTLSQDVLRQLETGTLLPRSAKPAAFTR